jgi:hypothetical protein
MTWISVEDLLPVPGVPVLVFVADAYGGNVPRNTLRLRAQYSDGKSLESVDEDEDGGVYDEATDTYYVREGWYETNEFEETHWRINGTVTHWMPLPEPPEREGARKEEPPL